MVKYFFTILFGILSPRPFQKGKTLLGAIKFNLGPFSSMVMRADVKDIKTVLEDSKGHVGWSSANGRVLE